MSDSVARRGDQRYNTEHFPLVNTEYFLRCREPRWLGRLLAGKLTRGSRYQYDQLWIGREVGMRAGLLGAIAFVTAIAGGAQAQSPLPESVRRARVVPLIRSLTNCVAQKVVEDDDGARAYRSGTLASFAVRMIGRCQGYVNDLVDVYDPLYGEGQAINFLNGPYASDLPRAVLARIKPQLDARVAVIGREEAEQAAQAAREEQARQEEARREEAESQTRIAEAEKQAAAAKAAAAQAEAEASAAAAKAEAERLLRIEEAKKTEGLLVDKAADCARNQLRSLVKSGEGAEVLASAVMTICAEDVNHALDAGVAEIKLEKQLPNSDAGEEIARQKLRAGAREQITALAVQA